MTRYILIHAYSILSRHRLTHRKCMPNERDLLFSTVLHLCTIYLPLSSLFLSISAVSQPSKVDCNGKFMQVELIEKCF